MVSRPDFIIYIATDKVIHRSRVHGLVSGVRGASYSGHRSQRAASRAFEEAVRNGEAREIVEDVIELSDSEGEGA